MEQISLRFENAGSQNETEGCFGETAKRCYDEIIAILVDRNIGYDISKVTIEHRTPEKAKGYDTVLMFNKPCFHIKGEKIRYLYMNSDFEKMLKNRDASYEASKGSRWARIALADFSGFSSFSEEIMELYEKCLRDADAFGCCGSYEKCSDAKMCIKDDIMFAGRCIYRKNLKDGKIFYGVNRNI